MSNRGVQFEKDIVDCYRNRNFSKHSIEVASATRHLIGLFPKGEIKHRDEVSLKGRGLGREIKADLWIDGHGVSVKLSGPVQLSSAEGKSTAASFKKIQAQLELPQRKIMAPLIVQIEQLPRVMVADKNREKAHRRKPQLLIKAINYDKWFEKERLILNQQLKKAFQDPQISEAIVHEMLTGRQTFKGTCGVADYILTPTYFQFIDNKYVQRAAEGVKIDVRGKSRAGISSACIRLDFKI